MIKFYEKWQLSENNDALIMITGPSLMKIGSIPARLRFLLEGIVHLRDRAGFMHLLPKWRLSALYGNGASLGSLLLEGPHPNWFCLSGAGYLHPVGRLGTAVDAPQVQVNKGNFCRSVVPLSLSR